MAYLKITLKIGLCCKIKSDFVAFPDYILAMASDCSQDRDENPCRGQKHCVPPAPGPFSFLWSLINSSTGVPPDSDGWHSAFTVLCSFRTFTVTCSCVVLGYSCSIHVSLWTPWGQDLGHLWSLVHPAQFGIWHVETLGVYLLSELTLARNNTVEIEICLWKNGRLSVRGAALVEIALCSHNHNLSSTAPTHVLSPPFSLSLGPTAGLCHHECVVGWVGLWRAGHRGGFRRGVHQSGTIASVWLTLWENLTSFVTCNLAHVWLYILFFSLNLSVNHEIISFTYFSTTFLFKALPFLWTTPKVCNLPKR